MFMMLPSIKVESEASINNFPVVCTFLEVFPKEINGLPPEHEMEFLIELVPGIGPI